MLLVGMILIRLVHNEHNRPCADFVHTQRYLVRTDMITHDQTEFAVLRSVSSKNPSLLHRIKPDCASHYL